MMIMTYILHSNRHSLWLCHSNKTDWFSSGFPWTKQIIIIIWFFDLNAIQSQSKNPSKWNDFTIRIQYTTHTHTPKNILRFSFETNEILSHFFPKMNRKRDKIKTSKQTCCSNSQNVERNEEKGQTGTNVPNHEHKHFFRKRNRNKLICGVAFKYFNWLILLTSNEFKIGVLVETKKPLETRTKRSILQGFR